MSVDELHMQRDKNYSSTQHFRRNPRDGEEGRRDVDEGRREG